MTIVFRVHLTGFVLLSYAVLIASMSVQKLTVNSSQPTQETKSSSMPESFNEANGAGIMHTRGVGSARRFNNTLSLHNLFRRDVDPPAANMPKLVSLYGPLKEWFQTFFCKLHLLRLPKCLYFKMKTK